jgi:hypothetical protein
MPKDSPGQIAKLQLNTLGYSGQAAPSTFSLVLLVTHILDKKKNVIN